MNIYMLALNRHIKIRMVNTKNMKQHVLIVVMFRTIILHKPSDDDDALNIMLNSHIFHMLF